MSVSRLSLLAGGLGNLHLRETSPSAATAFTIASLMAKTNIAWNVTEEEAHDERGRLMDVIENEEKFVLDSTMMQSRKEDIDLIMGHDGTKRFCTKYFGVTRNVFQYFLLPKIHVSRNNGLLYEPKMRTLRLLARTLDDGVLVVPSWEWPYIMEECEAEILQTGLQLWIAPHLKANQDTALVYDISGFERHGTLAPSGDVGGIWDADNLFLAFDGVNDVCDFGNVFDLDADDDFMMELWVKMTGTNGVLHEIASKKAGSADEAGWYLIRDVNNFIEFKASDGADSVVLSSDPLIVQLNETVKITITGDRDGNIRLYLNGDLADQAAMSSIGSMSTATTLMLAKLGAGFGKVNIGAARFHNFGATALPLNISGFVGIAAERDRYGV